MKAKVVAVAITAVMLCILSVQSEQNNTLQSVPPSIIGADKVKTEPAKPGVAVSTVTVETANTYGPINLAISIPSSGHFIDFKFYVKEGAVSQGVYTQCTNPDHSCPSIGWAIWSDPVQFKQDNDTTMTIQTTFWNSSNNPRRGRFVVSYQ